MNQETKAYLNALTAVLIWSTVASAFKICLRYMDFILMLLLASFFSTLSLMIVSLLTGKFRDLKTTRTKDIGKSALMGFVNPFIYYIILFKAYALLPAQEAQPLNYTWPIVLSLLSIPFLKQKIRLVQILAIFISFFGVIIISTHGDILSMKFTDPFGVALAMGSAIFWASYWLMNVRDKRESTNKLLLNFLFGTFYILIVNIIFLPEEVPELNGILAAAYTGIFEMGVTFIFWMKAMKLTDNNAKIGNLIYLSPFLSLVFIHFIVGEEILFSTIIGLVFVMIGIIVQNIKRLK